MLTIRPAKDAPAHAVHGLSMQPKIRAVLDKGLEHEYDFKEFAQLTGLSERSVHNLFERGQYIKVSRYPAKSVNGCKRRVSGLSVLCYLIEHSDEITEADTRPIMKKVLPLMTDALLERVINAAQALIRERAGLPVIVKAEEPSPAAAGVSTPTSKRPANVIAMHPEFSFTSALTSAAASA
jgi:AraC-like DNA-binding protein